MNSKGLVDYAKTALAQRWGYVWGTFGKVLTPALFAAKLKQYPDGVGSYSGFIQRQYLGKRTADCVGLIKGYYWGGGYDGNTDVTADGMWERATEKGSIESMPDTLGICVCMKGHIGVYIGGGQVIEAHGTTSGVIQTPLKGGTPWTRWCKCPYIEYPTEIERRLDAMKTTDLQKLLNTLGVRNDIDGQPLQVDGDEGTKTRSAKAKAKELLKYILA